MPEDIVPKLDPDLELQLQQRLNISFQHAVINVLDEISDKDRGDLGWVIPMAFGGAMASVCNWIMEDDDQERRDEFWKIMLKRFTDVNATLTGKEKLVGVVPYNPEGKDTVH